MECEITILHEKYGDFEDAIANLEKKNYPFVEKLQRDYSSIHLDISDLEKLYKCIDNVEEHWLERLRMIEKECCKMLQEFEKEIPEEILPAGPDGMLYTHQRDIYRMSKEVFEFLTFLKQLKDEFPTKFDHYEVCLEVLKEDAYGCLKGFQENELKPTFWSKCIGIRTKMDRLEKQVDKAMLDYEQFEKRLMNEQDVSSKLSITTDGPVDV